MLVGASSASLTNGTTLGGNNGLVGLWTFDGKDTNWRTGQELDESGQGNTGTLVALTQRSADAGHLGQALSFDGSTSYVLAQDSASLKPTLITVVAWVKRNGNQGSAEIVSKHTSAASSGYQLEFIGNSNLGALVRGAGGQVSDYDSGYSIPDGTWTHVAFTYDGSTLILYANGSQVGSPQSCSNCLAADSIPMGIGVNTAGYPSVSGFFSGSIDDVRIYNRALGATEVKQLYKLGTVTVHSN